MTKEEEKKPAVKEEEDIEKAMKEIMSKQSEKDKLGETLQPLISAATKIGEASKKLPEGVRQPFSDLTSLLLLQQVSSKKDDGDPYGLKEVEGAFYRRKHMKELMKTDRSEDEVSPLNKQIVDSMNNLAASIKEIKENKIKSDNAQALSDLKGIMSEFFTKIEGKIPSGSTAPENPIDMLNKTQTYIQTAENLLKATGRNVTQTTIDANAIKEDILKNPDAIAEILEKHGYKITGKPVAYKEYEEAVKSSYDKGKAEAADNFAIERTGKTLENVVSTLAEKIIGPFLMRYGMPYEVQEQAAPQPQEVTPPPAGDTSSPNVSQT